MEYSGVYDLKPFLTQWPCPLALYFRLLNTAAASYPTSSYFPILLFFLFYFLSSASFSCRFFLFLPSTLLHFLFLSSSLFSLSFFSSYIFHNQWIVCSAWYFFGLTFDLLQMKLLLFLLFPLSTAATFVYFSLEEQAICFARGASGCLAVAPSSVWSFHCLKLYLHFSLSLSPLFPPGLDCMVFSDLSLIGKIPPSLFILLSVMWLLMGLCAVVVHAVKPRYFLCALCVI